MVDDLVRQFVELKGVGGDEPHGSSWYYWFRVSAFSYLSVFMRHELTDDYMTELWVLFKLGGWHSVQMRLEEINSNKPMVIMHGRTIA